jgi:hypothetical protein
MRDGAGMDHDAGIMGGAMVAGDPADDDIRLVIEGELQLHQPEVRRSPAVAGALMHPDYTEVGASGRWWNRADMLAAMAEEPPDSPPITASMVQASRLSGDTILVTYISQAGPRRAYRSSVWLRGDEGWQVWYHQGTLAASGTDPEAGY